MSAEQSVLNQNAEPDWKNYDDFARSIDTNRLPGTRSGGAKRCRSPLTTTGKSRCVSVPIGNGCCGPGEGER